MIEITAEIRAIIDKAAASAELAGDEYIDPADGLIHCKKCKGQRDQSIRCRKCIKARGKSRMASDTVRAQPSGENEAAA